jgi:hypothetical protein
MSGSAFSATVTGGNGVAAWVNFDGTNTVAIRRAENITSITDSGLGLYDVNMTTAMIDTDYAVTVGKQSPAGNNINNIGVHNTISGGIVALSAPTTSRFSIMLNSSQVDSAYVMCAVFS